MLTTRLAAGMFSVGMTVLGADVVSGQDYPNKTIRIIAGNVGGSNDFGARLIAPAISGPLGQPVIIENRGGGFNAEETASKALPDGYTLLLSGTGLWIGPLLRKSPVDAVRDFSPITFTTREPNLLVVTPSLPAKSVKELIALAKARPGELNYSFGGVGAGGHLAMELLKAMAGVKIEGISYKSDSQEISDLMVGEVQLTFQGGPKVGPHIKLGKLRALAVTSPQSSALYPGVPTVAETLPGFEQLSRSAVFAPAKTPESIIKRLNQEIVRVLSEPDVKKKFFDTGIEAVGSSPEEVVAQIRSDIARWGKVIKDAGIKSE